METVINVFPSSWSDAHVKPKIEAFDLETCLLFFIRGFRRWVVRKKISCSSWADTQIIPCLLACFFIPISALIILIIFPFHSCNRLTVTVVQLPAWCFRRLTFLSLPECFFFPSSFSFFVYHHSSNSSLHLPGHLSTPTVFWTVPLWPLCVPCKLLFLSFSPFPLACSPSYVC